MSMVWKMCLLYHFQKKKHCRSKAIQYPSETQRKDTNDRLGKLMARCKPDDAHMVPPRRRTVQVMHEAWKRCVMKFKRCAYVRTPRVFARSVCVCACVRACVCECARVLVCTRARVRACAFHDTRSSAAATWSANRSKNDASKSTNQFGTSMPKSPENTRTLTAIRLEHHK